MYTSQPPHTHLPANLALLVRNDPIVTQIGVGKVIKGWDEGIQLPSHFPLIPKLSFSALGIPQLSLGQKAILTVTPDYVRNFTLRVR